MNSITVHQLQQKIEDGDDFQLIDVREPFEYAAFNIGGELIPLGTITNYIEKIAKDKPVVVYCRKGIRSQIAIQRLQQKYPFANLINLIGGTDAWQQVNL
jgi:rhodanese-related sulfurtransferase